ncbi:DUF1643 domain-containing protein [Ferviditalea candida]|uniref:DUF1643 domain-containing protein n=1 Tax=Ferviditalea candida TaxID=3108399 RepID=A0ABU5ZHT3_9BACL|nr:DUF1643 domain-containing protein [Paenibacillaceae bacterium T2]
MTLIQAEGTFVKDNSLEYRIEAQLKIKGNSPPQNILLIMLNPGDSKLQNDTAWNLTKNNQKKTDKINLDKTMNKVVYLLKKADSNFNGSVHILNLFNLRHTKAQEAIQEYVTQKKDKSESPFLETDFSIVNLTDYDFTWVAWSLEANSYLNNRKKDVLCHLRKQGEGRIIGKFESCFHARHLRPRLKKHQDEYESYIVPELCNALALRK